MVHDSLSDSELDHYIQVHGGGSKKASAKIQMDGSSKRSWRIRLQVLGGLQKEMPGPRHQSLNKGNTVGRVRRSAHCICSCMRSITFVFEGNYYFVVVVGKITKVEVCDSFCTPEFM
jgi:hypothetical protein